MSEVTANYDQSWKEALNEYFESFLAFFFPVAHQAIDWTKIPESLDKELQEITASGETKNRITDKLYKVWLLNQTQVSVNQKVFPKERFLRSANAIATDEAGINNKIR
jgi:hypothetical protein